MNTDSSLSLNDLKTELDRKWNKTISLLTEPYLNATVHLQDGLSSVENLNQFLDDLTQTTQNMNFPLIDELGITIEATEFTENTNKDLGAHLTGLKSLQYLDLTFKNYLDDNELKEIGSQINQNLTNLEALTLDIINSSRVSDQGVEDFMNNISNNVPVISKLSIRLRESSKVTDKVLDNISKYLRQLKNLRHIELSVPRCINLTDEAIENLTKNITSHLRGLKTFHFSAAGCTKITDHGLKKLSLSIATELTDLEDLKIDLSDCHEITDDGVTYLALQLINFSNLRRLSLWFTRCAQLSDKSLQELTIQISDFQRDLQEVHIDMTGSITDSSFKDLVVLLTNNLSNLERLNIELAGQVTDHGIQEVAAHILNGYKKPKNLQLNLSGCHQISSGALISARNMLKEIPNISIL